MKIYVIGGKAKVGKSTFGEYLKEELKDYGYKPCVMHLTTPLYQYANTYFEWDGNENTKPREFFQKMGIDIIKNKLGKENFLLDRLFEDIEILGEYFDTFIITDARLIHEFEAIRKKYPDVVIIKLERPNFEDNLTPEEKLHVTEQEVDKYEGYDYVIENKIKKDLEKGAMEIVRNEENYGGGYFE